MVFTLEEGIARYNNNINIDFAYNILSQNYNKIFVYMTTFVKTYKNQILQNFFTVEILLENNNDSFIQLFDDNGVPFFSFGNLNIEHVINLNDLMNVLNEEEGNLSINQLMSLFDQYVNVNELLIFDENNLLTYNKNFPILDVYDDFDNMKNNVNVHSEQFSSKEYDHHDIEDRLVKIHRIHFDFTYVI